LKSYFSCYVFKEDETALLATVVPSSSLFRSLGDLSLTKGTYSLTQPTISLFDTKQLQDVLMSLNGLTGTYYDYLRVSSASFIVDHLGIKVLHDGVFVVLILLY
jgi:molybdopterin-containing oxidoreductase family iron-sulfur binding subunit